MHKTRDPHGSSLDLALIGNGAVAALVDRSGVIVWCCYPCVDGFPLFSELMPGGEPRLRCGHYRIELENGVRTEQAYEGGTAVLRTRLFDQEGGSIEITDFAPRFEHHGRTFRPAQLVRRVRVLSGLPRVRVLISPR